MVTKSLLCCTVLIGTLTAGDTAAASASGNAVGNMAQGAYGNSAGITNSISAPLMGGGSFKTLDGKNTFTSNVQCPSTIKSVSAQFIPTAGGEWQMLVSQDMDLDGKFDYTYDSSVIGGNISGVCSAGVITCAPAGTWSGDKCRSYIWGVDSSRKLALTPIQNRAKELGSCHCTNSSCGGGVLNANVYDPIAGGMATILMKDSVNYLHSKNEFNQASETLSLFGQDRNNCQEIPHGAWDQYGEKHPEKYFATQQPPLTSIADVALEQGNDPHSYYSLLSHQNEVAYGKGGETIGMPSKATCNINKAARGEIKTMYENCSPISWNGKQWCVLAESAGRNFTQITDVSTILHYSQSMYAQSLDFQPSWCDDDGFSATVQYAGNNKSYNCGNARSGIIELIGENFTANDKTATINLFQQVHYGGGKKAYDSYDLKILKTSSYEAESFSVVTTDGCPTDKCVIENEEVCDASGGNCVYTIQNTLKKNPVIPQQCQAYQSTVTNGMICANGSTITLTTAEGAQVLYSGENAWFKMKRTYNCGNTEITMDVSKMDRANRTAYKDPSSTTMQYTDENGNNKSINNLPKGDNCPAPVCTVKKEVYEADVFSDGTNRSQTTSGTKRYEINMKTCQKQTSSGTAKCVVDTGETMIEDCSCTGSKTGTATTLATLAVMDEMLKDKICSGAK